MKKFRILGILCVVAIICTVKMDPKAASTNNGSYSNDVKDSYAQSAGSINSNYSKDKLKKCEVKDPNSQYDKDSDMRKYSNQAIKEGYKVYDLKKLADNGIFNFKINSNKVFNYGFIKTKNIKDTKYTIFCKCSQKDFNEFMKYNGKDYTYDSASGEYKLNVNGHECSVLYDSSTDFLRLYII